MKKGWIAAVLLAMSLMVVTVGVALAAPPDQDRQDFVCEKSENRALFCTGTS